MTRRHVVADLWVRDAGVLRYQEPLRSVLRQAITGAGATILGERFHQFRPVGFSGCYLLAESHVSVHSFVEEGLLSLDVFTCGDVDVMAIIEACRAFLSPCEERVCDVPRG